MGREIRRVPLDFDWPLHKVWKGWVYPDKFKFPECSFCEGTGYSPEAYAISETFYASMMDMDRTKAKKLCWYDKLGQAEVDFLVSEGRLKDFGPNPTADEVNSAARERGLVHDAINRGCLVEFRCKQLGIERFCPHCNGYGDIATDEQREAVDAWEGTPPPEGDGYQIWETVSEGSPVSPVFKNKQELINWLVDVKGVSLEGAEGFAKSEWVPSAMGTAGNLLSTYEAGRLMKEAQP